MIFPHRPDNDKFLKCVSSEAENFRGLGLLTDVGGRKTSKQISSFYNKYLLSDCAAKRDNGLEIPRKLDRAGKEDLNRSV